ncbi:MAG: hypothetical protein Q3M30_04370 [Candidatus Electrothrix sp. Rat3]|nr:hypothetical protein [Candidatus Electrothrix rattekaaiensis]
MKYKFTFSLFFLSFTLFLIEIITHFDIMEYVHKIHNTVFERFLPVVLFSLIGMLCDYVVRLKQKKDREKVLTYRATVRSANYLLHNVMSSMQLLSESQSVRKEFGDESIELMRNSMQEIEEILVRLQELKEITPQLIKEAADATHHTEEQMSQQISQKTVSR